MALDASRIINGTYGYVYMDGQWQTNVTECQAQVDISKKEILLAGDSWTRHKRGAKKGTGTMTGYKVTSDMIQRGFVGFDLMIKLADPESYGVETIMLHNVVVDSIELANYKAGDEITTQTKFTFEEYDLLDPIVAN